MKRSVKTVKVIWYVLLVNVFLSVQIYGKHIENIDLLGQGKSSFHPNDKINFVKHGYLYSFSSTTIGKAMDNWKACDNRLWKEGETDNGTNVVQFKCEVTDFRDMREYFDKANADSKKRGVTQSFMKNNNFQHLDYILIIIQWIINLDGTISTSYANTSIVWKDGVGKKLSQQDKESDNEIIHDILTMAYNNTGDNTLEFFGNDFAGYILGDLYLRIEQVEKYISLPEKQVTQKNTSINEDTQFSNSNANLVLQNLQNYLRKNDRQKIAELMQYPFYRTSPLPAIQSKKEFIDKFEYIFDDRLKTMIINATEQDILEMGYRAWLKDGLLLFINGKIVKINYQTSKEKILAQSINNFDKDLIHKSLKEFVSHEYTIETEKFKIRIDEIEGGKYRYASWKKDQIESDKPNLILNNGEAEAKGSGAIYFFEKGVYEFTIYIALSGGDTPKGYVEIRKDYKLIVEQDIIEVK